ncbi:MAG: murein transglycosylase domain-containing protein [Sulfuricellaceae bacterium]|jgi:membrane-bound lytic murein transglycosylase C
MAIRIKRRVRLAALLAALPLASCSVSQVVTVARSGSPEQALANLARQRVQSYETNPLLLVRDAERVKQAFDHLVAVLQAKAGKQWGQRDVALPSRKQYVKYTQNYLSRAVVDFDRGTVTVETVDQADPDRSLANAIVTTLLTPDDPRAVDMYSDKTVRLSGKPYLYGLVDDREGQPIATVYRAERYARYLLQRDKRFRPAQDGSGKRVTYVQFAMVPDHVNLSAQRYARWVDENARRFGVSKSLIYGIMETESAFNPFAVSAAPAYGLMQLVPATGGRDAYRKVKGEDLIPSSGYLFDPANNIELGTAYLAMLDGDYLDGVRDPLSREYCVIAAYNGGTGNVLATFSRDRDEALRIINRLSPAEVYQRLRTEHPRAETRRYLDKVLGARKDFINT